MHRNILTRLTSIPWNNGFCCNESFTSSSKRTIISLNQLRCIQSTASSTPDASSDSESANVPTVPQSSSRTLPLITSRKLEYCPSYKIPRQAWVENLDTIKEEKLGIIDLHPDVFAHNPRLDIINDNVNWQRKYKTVNWTYIPSRADLPGGGRKPWPQKGTGRARHGSIRSPLFLKGGKAHGPRGPKLNYYMLGFEHRVKGLCMTLSVKLAQDDIKIVDSLDIPTQDSKYLEDLAAERHWGISVLFVDDTDLMPENITMATDAVGHLNLMPVYGLNVYSMLKHETLVLTKAAVDRIEEKLIYHMNRNDPRAAKEKNHEGVQATPMDYRDRDEILSKPPKNP